MTQTFWQGGVIHSAATGKGSGGAMSRSRRTKIAPRDKLRVVLSVLADLAFRPASPNASARPPRIRPVRLKLYLVAGVVSGIAAHRLGAAPVWSLAFGAV